MVKFLKLPNLVKHLVFNEMELNEILLLSFCSKRVQKSIKQQYRLRPNKGFCIACGMNCPNSYHMRHYQDKDEKRLELIVGHKRKDKKVINWKYVDDLDTLILLKELKFFKNWYCDEGFDTELKSGSIFEMNGLRCKYSISLDPKSGIPTLYFEKNMMKKWPMELHKYCVDLFRTTPDLEMVMNLNDSSDFPESQTIKDLYLHTSLENLDNKIADEFFEKANIQNSFSTERQILKRSVSDDSKLWNIPNLFISSYEWVSARQLTRFTGKNAYFVVREFWYNIVDISQDMNAFLKHWLSSDNINLKIMIVRGVCGNTARVFDGIETSKWDPEKRPARYVSNKSFERIWEHDSREGCRFSNGFSFWPNYLDCTDAFDIVRESDGLLASVKVEYSRFIMFVWHTKFL